MAKADLSADRLRELLSYDPLTGIFVWAKTASHRAPAGTRAGSLGRRHGYIEIRLDGGLHRAHRLAWLYVHGTWPVADIDHINGDRADNRMGNLRDVSRRVNLENRRGPQTGSLTQLLGVTFHKNSKLFKAAIKVKGKVHSLGYHKTPEEAHAAYIEAKRRLHEGCTI